MPARRRLYCPSCGSDNLRALGSNGIEPKPGYVCEYCLQKLRRRRSGWFYVVVVGLGLVMIPVGAVFLLWGLSIVKGVIGSVGGLICIVYAVLRLRHPVPLLERPELEYGPPTRLQPPPEPAEQPAPTEQPTLKVWRVSGILNQTGFAVIREVEAESGMEAASAAELDGMTVTQVDRVL